MSHHATFIQPNSSKPPTLTPGRIGPDLLRKFQIGCLSYFQNKDIDPANQVKCVAWGLQDPLIQDWYMNDRERIEALAFDAFIVEIRNRWLKRGWETTLRNNLYSSRMGNDSFWDWAVKFQSNNSLLIDSPSHMQPN